MDDFNFSTGFDDIDRVTSWTRSNSDTQSWNLDKIGNWQSTTGLLDSNAFNESRTHNDVHELTALNNGSSVTLGYDAKGNLTENSHGHDYTWDIDNHLKQAYKGNGNGGGIGKGTGNGLPNGLCRYEYDAIGRRVKKHVGNVETLFICSGQRVVAEYSSQGGQSYILDKEYVYGSYIDDVVAKVEAGVTLYYHSDRQFNVRGLTNSSGAIVELYAYSPYGKQTIMNATGTELTESANGNCYGFTGRYLDEETGLWYFRARYFDNEMGRFISRDALGYVDGFGLYNGYFASGFGLDPEGTFSGGGGAYWPGSPHAPGGDQYVSPQEAVERNMKKIKEEFETWHEANKDTAWTKNLPACPCKLKLCTENAWTCPVGHVGPIQQYSYTYFCNPDEDEWEMGGFKFAIAQAWGDYHPQGHYELRTKDPKNYGGSGQQCIYDEKGNLMEDIPAAGTADKESPNQEGGIAKHREADVTPFEKARSLDKHYGGDTYVKKYYEARPKSDKPCTK